ncbi:MAG: polyhydroxyalkanoate depolymerase [Dichotomicrobium sp.]
MHLLYHLYEMTKAAMHPARAASDSYSLMMRNPLNPLSQTALGKHTVAACELLERTTRRYPKPEFGIRRTEVRGRVVRVEEETVWRKPFCRLLHFRRDTLDARAARQPRVLIVAPMSGHYATLLRGTVEAMLPEHDVYITDWEDARSVPCGAGRFDLDDYIDYVQEMIALFRGDVHVMGVCQPSVPVLAAVADMEARRSPHVPRSMILMGGPVDTRISPTAVNDLAEKRGTDWFARNVISTVPWPNAGHGRAVYPGFLQLSGFMSMNLDRHINAHRDLFFHLVQGDGDSAEKHKAFYDEYLAVMDLTAEFFLQTVDQVFVRHALAKGEMVHDGRHIDPGAIRRTALMTVEGEKDDITGLGQCHAAHTLASALPRSKRAHWLQPGVGHYGIFNGSRFRREIVPRIAGFIRRHDARTSMTRRLAAVLTGGRRIHPAPPAVMPARGEAQTERQPALLEARDAAM